MADNNNRILFVLIIVVMVGIFYFVPYRMLNTSEKSIEQDIDKLRSDYNILQLDVVKQEQYENDIEEYKSIIEASDNIFPPDNNQERIIYTLNDIERYIGIEFDEVSFMEDEVIKVSNDNAYLQEQKYILELEKAKILGTEDSLADPNIPKFDKFVKTAIQTRTFGSYGDIKKLLYYLYPDKDESGESIYISDNPYLNKRVVINNIQIQPSGSVSGKEFQLNFEMNFYAYVSEDRAAEKIDLGEYEIGKDGIFDIYGELDTKAVPETGVTEKENPYGLLMEDEADLFVMLSSQAAAIESVVMGTKNDPNEKTYVYDNRNETTEGEIYVYIYDDQYYYRYKVIGDSYPDNYNIGVPFVPGEYIELQVISKLRNPEDDYSALDLSIINKTDVPFNVYYESEDFDNPRLNVVYTEGEVILP